MLLSCTHLRNYSLLVVDTNGYNENGLSQDMKEALKTYKLYGKTKEDMYNCTFCDYTSEESILLRDMKRLCIIILINLM